MMEWPTLSASDLLSSFGNDPHGAIRPERKSGEAGLKGWMRAKA
jgi:hypothetical protein